MSPYLTGSAEAKEGQITGGYVHDVEAGLHPWIAVLDFKSMYPSIMIGHNICYTTRIDPAQPSPPGEGRFHTSPIDSKFRLAEDRKGMVPLLLEDLMQQRDEHKAAIKAAQSVQDVSAEAFHDAMQYAVKIPDEFLLRCVCKRILSIYTPRFGLHHGMGAPEHQGNHFCS